MRPTRRDLDLWPMMMMMIIMIAGVLCPTNAADVQSSDVRTWWERSRVGTSEHYSIRSDLDTETLRPIARHLDIMYEAFSRRLAALEPRGPESLDVLVFRHHQDYEITLRARYGVLANNTAGMFFTHDDGAVLAFWTEGLPERRLQHIIQHEGFHQFAYSRFGDDLPIWVNEGLAEFFGEAIVVGRRLVIGEARPGPIAHVMTAVEQERWIPFRSMIGMPTQQWNHTIRNGTAELQYAQAWSMVHFLVYGEDGRYVEAFEHYLQAINRGLSSGAAFGQAFGGDGTRSQPDRDVIAAFEARWLKYVPTIRPGAMTTALERIEFLADGAVELQSRGHLPNSLFALRDALREIDFRQSVQRHGVVEDLDAHDDLPYTIPPNPSSSDEPPIPPRFAVTRPDHTRMDRRERHLNDSNPRPPAIHTVGLEPHELSVIWIRDPDNVGFRYRIEIRSP